jgi:hypothetical protein
MMPPVLVAQVTVVTGQLRVDAGVVIGSEDGCDEAALVTNKLV